MWSVLNAFWAAILLNLLVRIGKTNWQTRKQMSFSHLYVTCKPTQTKVVWGKLASSNISTAMRHLKVGQNCYRTFKAGSTESCQIQLAAALLSWYSVVQGQTCFKGSFRKGLDKNHCWEPTGKDSKSGLQDEGEGSETKQEGKNRSSKWEPQVGNLVLANAKQYRTQ